MKNFKKAIILSSMLLCSCVLPMESNGFQNFYVSAADSSTLSGTVSSDFNWSYDKETKTLTLSGKGDLRYEENPKWVDFASEIKNIVISDGITSIDKKFFDDWSSLDSFSIGKDLLEIYTGGSYFEPTWKMSGNKYIVSSENSVFSAYDGLLYNKDQTKLISVPQKKTEFHFPSTLTTIGRFAFYRSAASVIILPEGVTEIEVYGLNTTTENDLIVIPNSCKVYETDRYTEHENATYGERTFYLYSNKNTGIESYIRKSRTDFDVIDQAWGRIGYKNYDEIYSSSTTPTSYGWKEVSGFTFYLSKDGLQDEGWVFENGSLYYFKFDSSIKGKYTGARQINNKTYIFDEDGQLIEPIPERVEAISAETFEPVVILNSEVTPGTNLNGIVYKGTIAYYYKNGKILTSQWVEWDGDYYYLDDSGKAEIYRWHIKDGKYRYLGHDGKMKRNNWINDNSSWYYVKADGTRYESSWAKLNGKWFWFGGSGKMMANGWLKMKNGKWYYFDASGAMAASRWIKSGSKWYYVDASGAMVTNRWIKSSGKWYYLGSSGAMLTNTKTPDGYRVDKNGVWMK